MLIVKDFKDGAYYCYCAYVLRIAKYSGFLWVVPTNTGIFLRGLKLYEESRTYQMLLVPQKKIGGNHAFFRDNLSFNLGKKSHTLLYILAFYIDITAKISLKNAWLPPIFFLNSNRRC